MASVRIITDNPPDALTIESVALEKPRVVFGRHRSCDHVLTHRSVSRWHFAVERVGPKHLIVDLNSGNGTLVNGVLISWIELKNGDKIKVGPFSMIFDSELSEPLSPASPDVLPSGPEKRAGGTPGPEPAFDQEHFAIYPRGYLEGIEHFNAGRYYDAHEVWEEIWLRSQGPEKLFYQMLIQAAVGLHHYQRANSRGVRGMYKAVSERLTRLPSTFNSLDLVDFSCQYASFFKTLIESEEELLPNAAKPRPRIALIKAGRDI
jgi:hypothetical protein